MKLSDIRPATSPIPVPSRTKPSLPASLLRLDLPRLGYDVNIDDGFTDIVKQGYDAGIRMGEMVERGMFGVRVSEDLRMAIVGSPS